MLRKYQKNLIRKFRTFVLFRNFVASPGFTLIEAVVSTAVFAMAFTSIAGVYISVQHLNQKSIALQALQQNARYISEDLAKVVRNGQVDYGRYAQEVGGRVTQPTTSNLYLLDSEGTPVRIYRSGETLIMEKTVNAQVLTTNFTGSEVRILNFAAYIWPATNPFPKGAGTPKEQPTVTVYVDLESNINSRDRIRMPFQVTVTTRQYPE